MTEGPRAWEILAAWCEAKQRGEAPEPADLIVQHPEHAEALRRGFAAVSLLDRAVQRTGRAPRAEAASSEPPRPTSEPRGDRFPQIPDFRILREIGRGGMGVVYEAEQLSMRRPVALKTLFPSIHLEPTTIERFRREAQAAGRLHHTNIVPVFALGCHEGIWFYTMELVHGRALSDVLAEVRRIDGTAAPPTPAEISSGVAANERRREGYARLARAFAALADALETVHSAGVVHRDIKPSNILLDTDGTLKILDFGLARVRHEGPAVTVAGDVVGTPAYMSPEQARAKPVDERSDVYSLGATLYEVLAHRPPFEGNDVAEIACQLLTKAPRWPSAWVDNVPRDLETIVMKAMEKEPSRRYARAAEMAHDLLRFAEDRPIHARRIGPLAHGWRWMSRHPVLSVAALLLVLTASSVGYLFHRVGREEARREALEYDDLVRRAEVDIMASRDATRPRLARPGGGWRHLLERAIDLAPGRPEAYFVRSFAAGTSADEQLADLDAARERGLLTPRGHLLARSLALRWSGRLDDSEAALAAADSAPPSEDPITLLLEARRFTLEGKPALALNRLSLAADRDAPSALVHSLVLFARAGALELLGDWHGALEALAALSDGFGCEVRVRIASLWRRLGDPSRARVLFDEVVADTEKGGSEAQWLELCTAAESAWAGPGSAELTQRAVLAYPSSSPLWSRRAQALNRIGDLRHAAEALAAADQAIRLDGQSAEALMTRAAVLQRLRRFDEALADVEAAVRLDPTSPSVRAGQASALALAGRLDEGIASLRSLIELHPTESSYLWSMALLLDELGQPAEALTYCDRVLALDPGPRIEVQRAHLLMKLRRLDEAELSANRAVTMAPDWNTAHAILAAALMSLARYEDALVAYDRAIELVPQDGNQLANRAQVLQLLGRHEDALASVDKALSEGGLDPVSPHVFRSTILLALGRPLEALCAADRAHVAAATPPIIPGGTEQAQRAQAAVLRSLGRFEDALAMLTEGQPDAGTRHARERLTLLCDLRDHERVTRLASVLRERGQSRVLASAYECLVLRALGRGSDAERLAASVSLSEIPPGEAISGAFLCALSGRLVEAKQLLPGSQMGIGPSSSFRIAVVHALLGDKDSAMAFLSDAVLRGWKEPPQSCWMRELSVLEGDPRFGALRDRLTLK